MIGDFTKDNTLSIWGKQRNMGSTVVLPLNPRQQGLNHHHIGKVKVSVGLFSRSTSIACQGVISECGSGKQSHIG